jgi:transcription-repair coupling factor (superfamily II helicase)
MAGSEPLHVPLGEAAALPALDADEGDLAGGARLPPVPPPELPEGRPIVRAHELEPRVRAPSVTQVVGVRGSGAALVVGALVAAGRRALVVVDDAERAADVAKDVGFVTGLPTSVEDDPTRGAALPAVLTLSPSEVSPYADVNPDRRAAQARLATLFHLAVGLSWSTLVVPVAALARKVQGRDGVLAASELVRSGDEIVRDELVARLVSAGYARTPLVEDPGTLAVRGALVDVWPPTSREPLRIELFGDLVMSIRAFDPDEQRTRGEDRGEAWLSPVREARLGPDELARARERVQALCDEVDYPSSKTRALLAEVAAGRVLFSGEGFLPAYTELGPLDDYLEPDVVVVLVDPPSLTRALRDELGRAVADHADKQGSPRFSLERFYLSEAEIAERLGARACLALFDVGVAGEVERASMESFERCPEDAPSLATFDQAELVRAITSAQKERGKGSALDPLLARLDGLLAEGYRVVLTARAATQVERLVSLLRHRGAKVRARTVEERRPLARLLPERGGEVLVVVGALARGLIAPAERLCLVTEEEVFGTRAHRKAARAEKQSKKSAKAFLEDLRGLSVGDFVVHVEHGIGRYLGLVHREVGGATVDLLAVEYHGGDKLYLPVYRLNQIQKYAGGDAAPKIDRLGGQTFAKTKERVRKGVRQMADELLRLYAVRAAAVGEATPPIDDDYRAFEATFPFDETPDQARAIAEVGSDLEAPRPMDRLVCGDVGFGKTEVAIRAAYRVAASGRQVAVLCPTTVLAQQHFLSFQARTSGTALVVRALSRFQSKSEQDAVVRDLKAGKIDIVVGTHRLLSKDVHFSRLGLLVVDEEQRFGVGHKERIKALRHDVDVLTLSATPIPRTLQMAVSGLRDMSLITTPPVDRRAIRTLVVRWDEAVVRDAVTRELDRGGQVFFVYNRVDGLYERAGRLAALVPRARIGVVHGQLGEAELEKTMLAFVSGELDVLCATAIVESGLDIPRANTMLIDRADLFGLSQLYQLRGRVGRSRERAYCYLVVPPPNAMTDEARARIEALERHTELGSGFQIASLDLELRGAGDLLGAEQSGSVGAVGFELFCQMLEEAVHELRGEAVVHEVDPELSYDVEALLPEDYVADVGVRLSLYKRLASAEGEAEVAELGEEMEDRFGEAPPAARAFVHLMRQKTELRRLRVLGCEASKKLVTLHLRQDTPLDTAKVLKLVSQKGSAYRLTPDLRLSRRAREGEVFASGLDHVEKVLAELSS